MELPELDIGDWLLFPQMGAYTVAAASSFNGFAPPNSTYIMVWLLAVCLHLCLWLKYFHSLTMTTMTVQRLRPPLHRSAGHPPSERR